MSFFRKNILFYTFKSDEWIGGIYYIKNMAFQLSENSTISKSRDIFIYTFAANRKYFSDIEDKVRIRYFDNKPSRSHLAVYYLKDRIRYIFPSALRRNSLFLRRIDWIPDFQDSRIPANFSAEEIERRRSTNELLARKGRRVVLSSQDCLNDFYRYYAPIEAKVYVVPFVSYIEPEIRKLTDEKETAILSGFSLQNTHFAVVMNQFWKHKNHAIVLEAIKLYLKANSDVSFQFVFTGRMEDYRNPEYISYLKTLADDPLVTQHIKILGFIDRIEQVALMKRAEYVIQPSLSEGWGTVVEDAKVLNKTILLSDIPIHREQRNEKCILFNPHDADALAELIGKENALVHSNDIEEGIADMHTRAKKYSKGFEQLLKDMERNGCA